MSIPCRLVSAIVPVRSGRGSVCRPFVGTTTIGHELVELRLVLVLAQAVEIGVKLFLLLFEALEGLFPVLIERVVATRA